MLENKESAIIAHDALLDHKVANSMIDTIQEMKSTNDVYVPDFNKESKLNSLASDPLHFQAFSMIIDKIRDRMKHNKMKVQGDDFVKKNKVLIKYWNQYDVERRRKHQDSLHTNLQTVLKRKEVIMRFKREKQEILVKMKEKLREEEMKRKKQSSIVRAWVAGIQTKNMLNFIHEKYIEKKQQYRSAHLQMTVHFKMNYSRKKRNLKKGPNLSYRMLRDVTS